MAEPGVGQKTCFVAMPVTTPKSYADDLRDADHFGHVLKYLFTPALEQAGYAVIPPKVLGAALIHAEIIRYLEQADLVLADLSNHNPNVFFELGIRTSLDRPVVLVTDARSAAIPFDLGTINVLTYAESLARWTLDEEIKRLAEHVRSVPTDDSSGNAMWRYFGLTKRGDASEAGSLEAKVDLILAEVTKLRLGAGQDWKRTLQELVAAEFLGVPEYMVEESGPDHRRLFQAEVRVGGRTYGSGSGRSKKDAEQRAAEVACLRIRTEIEDLRREQQPD